MLKSYFVLSGYVICHILSKASTDFFLVYIHVLGTKTELPIGFSNV